MRNPHQFSDHRARIRYGWDLYRNFIKKDANEFDYEVSVYKKIEAANEIISLYKPMEPYTSYALTCLSMAEYYLEDNHYEKGREWLSKIDKFLLENDTFQYTKYNEKMYWSQLRKFLELKAKYFLLTNNFDKFIWINFCLLEQCNNSKNQTRQINDAIYDANTKE